MGHLVRHKRRNKVSMGGHTNVRRFEDAQKL